MLEMLDNPDNVVISGFGMYLKSSNPLIDDWEEGSCLYGV